MCLLQLVIKIQRNKRKQGIKNQTKTKQDATIIFTCENAWRKVWATFIDAENQQGRYRARS